MAEPPSTSSPPARRGLCGDVVGSLVSVDLSSEVDREADEEDHHEAGQGQPDSDGSTLVPAVHRSRQVSIGLDMVASQDPGSRDSGHGEI